jgi:hypothetical protein
MTLGKKLYLWLACGVMKEEIKTFIMNLIFVSNFVHSFL